MAHGQGGLPLVVLGVLLGAAGASLLVMAPARSTSFDVSVALVLALLFVVAESSQVHIEVQRQTFSVSLSDLPLIIGLFILDPWLLLVARLAAALLVFLVRRTALGKVVCNLGLFAAEVGAGAFLLGVMHAGAGTQPADWAAAYVTTMIIGVLGTLTVLTAMRILQGWADPPTELPRMAGWIALTGASNTTIAMITLLVLETNAAGAVLLLVVMAVLVHAYRGYQSLLRRNADLGHLFAFTQGVGADAGSDELVNDLLRHVREALHAESAVVRPHAGDGATDHGDDAVMAMAPLVVPRDSSDPRLRAWLRRHDLNDAMVVRLRPDGVAQGSLVVGNRLGAMSTFTRHDLRLLLTLTAHAEVLWRNSRLLDRQRHAAQHDALTGLPNRSVLVERLRAVLGGEGPLPSGIRPALLSFDLDRFKEVNDTLGHHVGDLLLRLVATRLRGVLPADAELARLGADEFAVLLPACANEEEALATAATARAAVSEPFEIAGTLLEVTASVGVALAPHDGREPGLLLQHADVAMHLAKRAAAGVTRYRVHDDHSSLRRLALAGELRRAVGHGQLVVHFQPKMRLRDGAPVGSEALVRWRHPERGLLMPDEFIPIAEQTGLVVALTHEIFSQALDQCGAWLDRHPEVGVAVNVSARGLTDPALPGIVKALLASSRVPPHLLTIEITESSVMGDFPVALAAMHELNSLGLRLSIDDFGTGYSSLAYLQRLPVQEVKIDKSFVIPMERDDAARAIVGAIIELAHALKLSVVAEGVESNASRSALAAMGCDVMQGYLASRPLPAERFVPWLGAEDFRGRAASVS